MVLNTKLGEITDRVAARASPVGRDNRVGAPQSPEIGKKVGGCRFA